MAATRRKLGRDPGSTNNPGLRRGNAGVAQTGSAGSSLARGTRSAGLLASSSLGRLVVHFLLHPNSALHLRALRRHTGLGGRSLTLELDRLCALGLVRRVGNAGRVQFVADQDHPAWSPLWHLARYSVGAADVLGDALVDIEGIAAAFVYGSMARGNPRPDSDIDLFVIGDSVNPNQLAHATMAAGSLLGREVNVALYRSAELAEYTADRGGFVPAVLAGPKAWVVGNEVVLSTLLADISLAPKRKRA